MMKKKKEERKKKRNRTRKGVDKVSIIRAAHLILILVSGHHPRPRREY
jgi:hypothetical protein